MAGLRMRMGELTVGVDGLEGEGAGAGGKVMVVNMVEDAHVGDGRGASMEEFGVGRRCMSRRGGCSADTMSYGILMYSL